MILLARAATGLPLARSGRRALGVAAGHAGSWESDADVRTRALAEAEGAARAAGDLILQGMGADVRATKANFRDVVTEVDKACQEVVEQRLKAAFPDHAFLGEEDVPPGREAASAATTEALGGDAWCWVVDPVDGTANLAAGIPLCAVSIALVKQGEVQVGVVYEPSRDECFSAVKGCGATLNGAPLSTSNAATVQEAIVATGCPPDPAIFPLALRSVERLGPHVRGLRMLATAAIAYSWVAAGRFSSYVAFDINAWDFAAGKLLVEEAGGVVTALDGEPLALSARDTVCSNGAAVNGEIIRLLQ